MKKLCMFNMITLDGYFEGPNQELDFHIVDEEFNQFAIKQLEESELLIFGRKTYDLMASFWPTPMALKDDPIIAKHMNETKKLVFSNTINDPGWQNAKVNSNDPNVEIQKLKKTGNGTNKDLLILGSANLSESLIEAELIDEFRLIVCPTLLGNGHPLFRKFSHKQNLKLLEVFNFRSGIILLRYAPIRS